MQVLLWKATVPYTSGVSRIAIFGGSGKLGSKLLTRALAHDHRVNVLTRDPASITRHAENLTLIKGDAETGEGVAATVRGCRWIICALSSPKPVIAQCLSHVVRELQASRVAERVIFVSRIGVGDSKDQGRKVSGLIQPYMPVVKRPLFDDLAEAEELLRISGLATLILRATLLTDDESPRPVVTASPTDAPPHRIGRTALANTMLELLEAPTWSPGELTVGSAK